MAQFSRARGQHRLHRSVKRRPSGLEPASRRVSLHQRSDRDLVGDDRPRDDRERQVGNDPGLAAIKTCVSAKAKS